MKLELEVDDDGVDEMDERGSGRRVVAACVVGAGDGLMCCWSATNRFGLTASMTVRDLPMGWLGLSVVGFRR